MHHYRPRCRAGVFFFFKQKTAYEIGLGIPAEPLFRSKERILVIILLLHFLSLMLGSVLVLMLPLLVWLTPDLRIKKSLLKCNWTIRKRLPRCKMRLKKRLLAFSPRLHARIRKTRYIDRKSGSAGMPRPISYAVFCLKKKKEKKKHRAKKTHTY